MSSAIELRRKIVEKLNEADAAIAIAEKRVATARAAHEKLINDAKSEIGTAMHELRKAREEFIAQRTRLLKFLPDLGELQPSPVPSLDEALAAE